MKSWPGLERGDGEVSGYPTRGSGCYGRLRQGANLIAATDANPQPGYAGRGYPKPHGYPGPYGDPHRDADPHADPHATSVQPRACDTSDGRPASAHPHRDAH